MVTSGVPSVLVVVDKPGGMTSHAVVSRVRRAMGTRKVGHAGTLDPMATGVLVLGVERATRMLGHLMLTEKAYDATVRLGRSTTTDDAEGDVVADTPAGDLAPRLVLAAFETQVGDILQVPTAVSAIKVDGKRAYQRVRDGEQVELRARPVTVHALHVNDQRVVGDRLDVDITVRCSSGTYIRAIARDVGAALGVGGHLTALRRTAVGPFTLAEADADLDHVTPIPLARAARDCFPAVDLDVEQAQAVRYGRPLPLAIDTLTGVFAPDGEFLALYRPEGGAARPAAVFVG